MKHMTRRNNMATKKELLEENEQLKAKVEYLKREIQRLICLLAVYQWQPQLPKE